MKEYIEREAIIPALEDYYEPINPDFPMTLGLGQKCSVASCYRRGRRCKGYTIARMDKEDEHE